MLFENLQKLASDSRTAEKRAVIAAQTRAQQTFGAFLANAQDEAEKEARLSLIDSDVRRVAQAVCAEYDFEDEDLVYHAGTYILAGGHPAGCECGFCKNKGKGFGGDKDVDDDDDDDGDDDGDDKSEKKKEKDSAVKTADGFSFCECGCEGCDSGAHCESGKCIETKHSGNPGVQNEKSPRAASISKQAAADAIWATAAEAEDGDTYTKERVDLPTADATGLGGPSPKIDKGKSGDNTGWSLKPIDVPSEHNKREEQSIHETPDYGADLPGPSATGERVDADSPMQAEHNVADNTETWTGTKNQADPVTAKWAVIEA